MPRRLLLFALLAACGDTSSSLTTGTSTSAEPGTPTSSTATPTSDAPPDLPEATPEATPEAACLAYCEAQAQCLAAPVSADCVPTCIAGLGLGGLHSPACIAADAVLTACQATLDCAADMYRDPACEAPFRAALAACRVCQNTGGPLAPDGCYIDIYCTEGLRRMECRGATCVCSFDGAFIKTCPSAGCDAEGWPVTNFACCP